MSWRDAPLYIEVHEVARWVLERASGWPGGCAHPLAPHLAGAACDLVGEIGLALSFPAARAAHLEAADEALVRLRCLLRLARDLGLVSAGGLRFASGRLQIAGRMLGGWRKRVEHRPVRSVRSGPIAERFSGDGPPVARGG